MDADQIRSEVRSYAATIAFSRRGNKVPPGVILESVVRSFSVPGDHFRFSRVGENETDLSKQVDPFAYLRDAVTKAGDNPDDPAVWRTWLGLVRDAANEALTTGKLGSRGRRPLTLEFSGEAAAALDRLVAETGEAPPAIIAKALGLYGLAAAAKKDGKVVGAAASADSLDTEFTGF